MTLLPFTGLLLLAPLAGVAAAVYLIVRLNTRR